MTLAHRITLGHLLRHVPPASAIGTDVAALDIAQDFLLTHLYSAGVFDMVVFKGGTALRKVFAGAAGRFSTDIDLALASPEDDRETVAGLIAEIVDGAELGPFRFNAELRRGRWMIQVDSDLTSVGIPLKLDIGPPCWLRPDVRPFVHAAIHDRYDFALPELPTMRLEENLSEKVARLNRLATARDASDLVWVATTPPFSNSDRTRIRRLATLKIWADVHGLDGHWSPISGAGAFSADRWLRVGREWDDESIGLLAHPPPPVAVLEADMVRLWKDMGNLEDDETIFGAARESDRALVVAAIANLPDSALRTEDLWRHR